MMRHGGKLLPRWATLSAVIDALRMAARETGLDPEAVGTVDQWHQRLLQAAGEATEEVVREAARSVAGEGEESWILEWEERPEEGQMMVRPLQVVVPAALGEPKVLRKLVAEVQAVCEESARFAQWIQQNPGATAWDWGRAEGLQRATSDLEGRVIGAWEAWDQVEPQTGHPVAVEIRNERTEGWVWDRPDFPLPDDPEDVALGLRLMKAIRAEQDNFTQLAIVANTESWLFLEDNGEIRSPAFSEHMARAKTWAMAADRLEVMLAQAYGPDTVEAHLRFVEEHGPWLAKLIFP